MSKYIIKELKPCPFCGNNSPNDFCIDMEARHDLNNKFRHYFVHCWECGTLGPIQDTKIKAIAAWNERNGENETPDESRGGE